MRWNGKCLQKTGVIAVLASLANFLWGSAAPAIKTGYQLFEIASGDTATQILFAGIRFALAGLMVIVLGSLLNGKALTPSVKSIPKILTLAMLQTVIQYTLYYIGLAHTTGVKTSILNPTNVFIGILLSCLVFRMEKLTLPKVVGCLVGFAGVLLVNVTPGSLNLEMTLIGEGFIMLSSTAYAFSCVFIKLFSRDENPVMLSGYQFFAGGLIMTGIGLAMGGRLTTVTLPGGALLLYLAMVSAVAYSCWSLLLKYNPVSKISVFGFLNPVFGVLLSALLLGEGSEVGLKVFAALVLACIGIVIVNREKRLSHVNA